MLKVMESILVLKPKVALESKATSKSEAVVEGCIRDCQEQTQGSRTIAQRRLSRSAAKEGGKYDNTLRQVEKSGSLITRYGR